MPDYGNLIERASANGMGVLVIRVLAAGALTGEAMRHPVAVPSVAPIGSGGDYGQVGRLPVPSAGGLRR